MIADEVLSVEGSLGSLDSGLCSRESRYVLVDSVSIFRDFASLGGNETLLHRDLLVELVVVVLAGGNSVSEVIALALDTVALHYSAVDAGLQGRELTCSARNLSLDVCDFYVCI